MPEGSSQDCVKPVSILTNRSNSNVSTLSDSGKIGDKEEANNGKTHPAHPKYEPVDKHSYMNPQAVAPKLHLITKVTEEDEMSPSANPSSSSLRTPLTATSVSFTVPGHQEKTPHRRSISTRPSSSKQVTSYVGSGSITPSNSNTETIDSQSSRQNSIHMPGDFIYFEAKPLHVHETEHEIKPAADQEVRLKDPYVPVEPKKQLKKLITEEEPYVPFTELFQNQDDEKIHILIGATGSVATIKVPMIIDKLFKIYGEKKVSIQLVLTKHAEHFLRGAKINKEVKIWRDEDEWYGFKKIGDPVLHTELRKWADIFLVAPLSANTLAKMANGICDNLLTCLLRSWQPNVPVMIAPAMNTFMYIHPVTKKHLNMLKEDYSYIEVLKPVEKVLVCGDIGMGGMREWIEIVELLTKRLQLIKGKSNEAGTDEEENCEDVDDDDDDDDEREDYDDEDDDEDEDDDDDDDDDDENEP